MPRSQSSRTTLMNDYTGSSPARSSDKISGRSWTVDEESYLYSSRARAIPYKRIALHLNKTELACRLHYHQMTFASHRRQRNKLISSVELHVSPEPSAGLGMAASAGSMNRMNSIPAAPSPMEAANWSMLPPLHNSRFANAETSSLIPSSYSQPDPIHLPPIVKSGRNNHLTPLSTLQRPSYPDTELLGGFPTGINKAFWTTIAAACKQSPTELEATYVAACGSYVHVHPPSSRQFQLTPPMSPSALHLSAPLFEEENLGYQRRESVSSETVTAPMPNRCTISSLLNDNQESFQTWGSVGVD